MQLIQLKNIFENLVDDPELFAGLRRTSSLSSMFSNAILLISQEDAKAIKATRNPSNTFPLTDLETDRLRKDDIKKNCKW